MGKRTIRKLRVIILIALAIGGMLALPGGEQPVAAQSPASDFNYAHYEKGVVEIKFKEGRHIRLRNGQPRDLDSVSLQSAQAAGAFSTVAAGDWSRSHQLSEADLDSLRDRASQNAGEALPDLNLYFRLQLPPDMSVPEAIDLFSQLDEVEAVWPVPKPVSSPVPPNYQNSVTASTIYQGYLDPAPNGVDARFAWGGTGGTGAGITICDVERGLNKNHADLPTIKIVTSLPADTVEQASHDHGTAVLGQLGGSNNGWGITGVAYGAELNFGAALTKNGGYNIAAAIAACANALDPGDVILIEQQIAGPNRPANPPEGDQSGLVPVEWDKPTYDAIKTAVAAGIVVVEAAGNGGENLDAGAYSSGNGGHYPFQAGKDSGAILVGAGAPPGFQGTDQRARLNFSNYGATLDLQGWGTKIVTTGYGDLYSTEGENLWYRESFGGTSGASPIVAASAAIVQSTYKAKNGSPATPAQVKSVLRDTGTPQQGAQNIGPLPDLKAAIEEIWNVPLPASPIITPSSGTYAMPLQVSIDYAPGQNGSNTAIRYTLDGSEPTGDSYIFIPEQGDTIYLNYGATVKAVAFQFNSTAGRSFASPSATATYVSSTPKVDTPVITPGGGVYSQPHQVTISTTTPGATIRYRTDGRSISFFYPGTLYTGPITLDPGTYEISARAYKDGYYKSDNAFSGEVTVNALTLPSPTIYPGSGNYNGSVTVYMGSTVLGADLRYTLDGSTPNLSSPQFVEPLALTQTTTVNARVFLDSYTPSATTSETFNITHQAAPPIITPNGGTAVGTQQVTLSTTTSGATIRYTTNGAEPTSYSTLYSGPFNLGIGQHTVKAKAFLAGANPSPTASADFIVYDPVTGVVADPTMTPFSTQYFVAPFTVSMHSDTEDADIYYTINDGSLPPDPTESDTLYNGPFVISSNGSYFIKMRAFKAGSSPSNVVQSGQLSLGDALGTTALPTLTPSGGTFTNTVQMSFSAGPNEVIFYTTDGSDPVAVPPATPPSQQTSQGSLVTISQPTTVKANAYRVFFASGGTASADFFFQCDTPTIDPGDGTFTNNVSVSMSTGTVGGDTKITYTTDGSEPTAGSTTYSGPFNLGIGNHTIKAKCFRANYEESELATAVLVVAGPPVPPSYTVQPEGKDITGGTTVTFTTEVTGSPMPALQWQRNGIDIAGETDPTLVIPAATVNDVGSYRLEATNAGGTVPSAKANLVVDGVSDPEQETVYLPLVIK